MKARNAASPILLYSNAFNPALTLDVHQLINRYDMIPRYSQEMNVLIIPLDSNNPTIANWNAIINIMNVIDSPSLILK
jgi:hypothetical protein